MKKFLLAFIFCFTATSVSTAEPFAPTLLKIKADEFISYDFRCNPLDLHVMVEGTPAGIIFALFTKNEAQNTMTNTSGYLGWHYVNRIDTCIYYSSLQSVNIGDNVISWDGRDHNGNEVVEGQYTYYLWAFDNQSAKCTMSSHINADIMFDYTSSIIEHDVNNIPLPNPIWYTANERWLIGTDRFDDAGRSSTHITLDDGWEIHGDPHIDPSDMDDVFISVGNNEHGYGSIQKFKFVPDGEAVFDTRWGDGGFADMYRSSGETSSGVMSDNDYLYTIDAGKVDSTIPNSEFLIYDMDGSLITTVDLSPWWCPDDSLTAPGLVNSGPYNFEERNRKLLLNSHVSCLNQMIYPMRYLESEDIKDLLVWSNGNGDYVLDKNVEETATYKWVCNDDDAGPFKWSIGVDDNLFSVINAYGAGAVTFGLLAPDGTGLGYFAVAGETAGLKMGTKIIDSGTAYDGMYFDIKQSSGPSDHEPRKQNQKIGYLGHDSVNGVIYNGGDCFGICRRYSVGISNNYTNKVTAGEKIEIGWGIHNYCNVPEMTNIYITYDDGNTWELIAESISFLSRSYEWTVPDIISNNCRIRLDSNEDLWLSYATSEYTFSIVDPVNVADESPYTFTLSQNSPNPFNPVTTIPFTLPEESAVSLTVYSITGEKVVELVDGILGAGYHSVEWDASGVASGMYFARLKAGEFVETVKMTVVK